MTTYGTIPTSTNTTPTPPYHTFISGAKSHLRSTLSQRRPWSEFFSVNSFTRPTSLSDSHLRLSTNLPHFQSNYTIIILVMLFLSLLYHPISLIVFAAMMTSWIFLYFLREDPLVVNGRVVDDRAVLGGLGFATVVFLMCTNVTANIVSSIGIGVVVVVCHAVVRRTDDLPLSGDFDGRNVVHVATGGLGEKLPLKDAVRC